MINRPKYALIIALAVPTFALLWGLFRVRHTQLNHALIEATAQHITVRVEELLDKGADSEAANEDGLSVLSVASWNGDAKIVKLLLEHGAKVNKRNPSGLTPLLQAVPQTTTPTADHIATVALLLKYGAGLPYEDGNKRDALIRAASSGNIEVARLLLDHGAKIDGSNQSKLLMAAVHSSQTSTVAFLLRNGANPNCEDQIRGNVLSLAAANGHVKIIKLLLDHGAKINVGDRFGSTPLLQAASAGNPDAVALLLRHGADPALKNKYGYTAQSITVKYLWPNSKREERDKKRYREIVDLLRHQKP